MNTWRKLNWHTLRSCSVFKPILFRLAGLFLLSLLLSTMSKKSYFFGRVCQHRLQWAAAATAEHQIASQIQDKKNNLKPRKKYQNCYKQANRQAGSEQLIAIHFFVGWERSNYSGFSWLATFSISWTQLIKQSTNKFLRMNPVALCWHNVFSVALSVLCYASS